MTGVARRYLIMGIKDQFFAYRDYLTARSSPPLIIQARTLFALKSVVRRHTALPLTLPPMNQFQVLFSLGKEAQSENTSELSDTGKRMNKLVGLPRTVVIPWRDPDVLCSSRRCNAKHNSEIGQMTAMMAILPCWKCIEEALTPVDEGRKD